MFNLPKGNIYDSLVVMKFMFETDGDMKFYYANNLG